MEYIHQALDSEAEIKAISGYYTVEDEKRLELKDGNVLCVIGMGEIDSSCCGTAGCRYALVPGYIRKWKNRKNEEGQDISEVEPVLNEDVKKEISDILKKEDVVTQINFW